MAADVDSYASLPDVELKQGPLHLLDSVQKCVAGGNDLQPKKPKFSLRLNAVTLVTAVRNTCNRPTIAGKGAANKRPQQQNS